MANNNGDDNISSRSRARGRGRGGGGSTLAPPNLPTLPRNSSESGEDPVEI